MLHQRTADCPYITIHHRVLLSSPLLFARLLRWPQVSLQVVAVVRFIKILGQPSSPHDHAHRPKPSPPPPPPPHITRSRVGIVRARAPTVRVWRGLEVKEEKEREEEEEVEVEARYEAPFRGPLSGRRVR